MSHFNELVCPTIIPMGFPFYFFDIGDGGGDAGFEPKLICLTSYTLKGVLLAPRACWRFPFLGEVAMK